MTIAARRRAVPAVRSGMQRGTAGPALGPEASNLDERIARAQRLLFELQDPEGYWWGELESNQAIEAEYVFLRHILGLQDGERLRKIRAYLLALQLPDGGWGQYYGAGADLSTSAECYLALKMCGQDPDSDEMRRARRLVLSKGGVEKVRAFTKIWFAMLGQWDWKGTPYLAPELMLIPNRLPLNIYEFSSWTRATVVPMTIILSQRPTWPVPPPQAIDELYVNGRGNADFSLPQPQGMGWERILYAADRALHLADRLPWTPFRSRAIKLAEQWILDHQEADGSWGGIQPPWVYSIIALRHLGYPLDSGPIERGMQGFEDFAIEDDETWRLQACICPLWDTSLAINALLDSDVDADHTAIVKGAEFLIERQIKVDGDWRVKNRGAEPGGWAFEFENNMYPDIDDAAEILMAIGRARTTNESEREAAVERGITWTLSMQSRNGGWGAYDKNNTSHIVTQLPFFDFGETIDPPSADVTAHVVETIGLLGWPAKMPTIDKALDHIWAEQEQDGCWFGRWGVNYIWGTAAVLSALKAIGHDMGDPRVQRAAQWIEKRQNRDGGWGETCASYADPALRGQGPSTASQTAWALISLIAGGGGRSQCARRGAEYLMRMQEADGAWEEPQYTATGFPGYGSGVRKFGRADHTADELIPEELPAGFMIKYHMYRLYWPLMALGRYRACLREET